MLYEFIQSKQFSRTGRLRKMRWEYGGKGKRSGARVCYVDFEIHETIYLLLLYAKNEKEDLSEEEKKEVKAMIDKLDKELSK